MKFLFLFSFFCQMEIVSIASNWHSLGYGTNLTVTTIFIDSANNKLYAGGDFTFADSIYASGIAVWDGLHWDSMGAGIIYGGQPNFAISKYQNKIHSDGRFIQGNNTMFGGVFNGSSWDSIGDGLLGHIFKFEDINNVLWVGGFFNNAGNDSCWMLATWDGSNWNCIDVPYYNSLESFQFFDGGLVIGGNFFDTTGSSTDIAYFDSTTGVWSALGGGLHGGLSAVHAIQIYRGELYVAGYFATAAGNAGNNIMRWDGNQWQDVGGGTDNEIYCMNVFNDELYIGGYFENAGGVYTGGLAKWNGSQWMPVTSSVFYPDIIEDIQFWNGEMYVGGYFSFIDSIPVNNIAKYTGLVSVEENNTLSKINIYPNPSNSKLQIQSSKINLEKIKITNILGDENYSREISGTSCQLDISFLTTGLYFIIIETKEGRVVKKFIKE